LKKILSLFIIILFIATTISAQQILLDEEYSDWNNYIVYTDVLNDGSANGVDFENLGISNDDENLYIYFELNKEISLQEDNNLYLYVDTDNNINTGQFIRGIGADLVYAFGQNQRSLYINGFEWFIDAFDIKYIGTPTVTSDRFEIKISRTLTGGNNSINLANTIKVILEDNVGNGDFTPDNTGGYAYTLIDNIISTPEYSLEKANNDDIRFLCWNVERDNYFESGPREAINRILIAAQPDVIAFQEIYDHSAAQTKNQVAAALNIPSNDLYAEKIFPDIILVSKFPIIDVAAANGTGNGAFQINDGSRDWLVIVMHLPCCDNDDGREEEIESILEFIEESKTGTGLISIEENTPILIMGDANFVGFADQPILMQEGLNEGPDWGGVMEDLKPNTTGEPTTFTWYNPSGSFFSPGRLDYVFYSGSVVKANNSLAIFTESMNDDILDQYGLNKDDSTEASDHLAIVVDFDKEVVSSTSSVNTEKIAYYPNPVYDVIHFTESIKECNVYNLKGVRVIESNNSTMEQLNVSNLLPGIYFTKVELANGAFRTYRFIKI